MRLDRALVNASWLLVFPDSYAEALTAGISDHSPLVLTLEASTPPKNYSFKYLNCWSQDQQFLPLVRAEWGTYIRGCAMYKLVQHLKRLKGKLRGLHREHYANITAKVKNVQQQLHTCQEKLQLDPHNRALCLEEEHLSEDDCKFKNIELSIAFQRAKEFDIKMGDASTTYFSSKVAARRNSSNIRKVVDNHGTVCNAFPDISKAFLDYYISLLGAGNVTKFDSSIMPNGHILTPTEGSPLLEPITPAEIKSALFSIDANKSPGPDGYSSGFFKDAWDTIHDSFITAILDFFKTGKLLREVNSTLISLIPKGTSPNTVMDYRPMISCCTTIYKTISKILTSRLHKIMPHIVGLEQAAFVADRSIFDNIMLANELVRGYDRKYKTPRCVVKVDIRKAFDTVNWEFLKAILPQFGIPQKFCDWIISLVTSTRFSLKINGSTEGYFEGKRGLRQGDPLSHLLFVLCMEVLTRIFKGLKNASQFSFHPKCVKLDLTHLIFADDLLVFVRGDLPSVQAVKHCLDLFSSYSGLVPNASKTNIYFAGVRADVKSLIIGDTGYVEDNFQVNLLNSVIFGIEAYWCASLLLPKGVIKTLETECRKFLWGSAANRRMNFFSWNKVCRSRQQGGMDIREVLSWNKALMLQIFWKLCYKSTTIWMQWSTHYIFKLQSCWDLDAASCFSPLWAQILRIRDEFVQNMGSSGAAKHCFQKWMVMNKFPLHEAYQCFHGVHPEPKWMQPIIDSIVIPKHAFTATLAAHHGLATVDNICTRGMAMVNRCTLCYSAAENTQHLFFVCPFSNGILQEVLVWQGVTRRVLSLKHELYKLALYRGKIWKRKIACCALAATIHHIWQERNARIFKGVRRTPAQILARIKYEVCVRFYAWQRGVDTDHLLSLLVG
ncbi:uncharacterized protein LOC141632309 [Silene latifolia]|uniref:uncharacterized protein LOC141632309 n=1 Tax=Silene latifolia TaxID=37657 RepID=UPI003D783EE4